MNLIVAKTAITTIFRGVYPFASHFANALHVPTPQFFVILSFGELVGALCPLLGTFACAAAFLFLMIYVFCFRPHQRAVGLSSNANRHNAGVCTVVSSVWLELVLTRLCYRVYCAFVP